MSKNFIAPEKVIFVCTGKSCKKNGSKNIIKLYKRLAKEHHMKDLQVIKTKCTNNCKFSPVLSFQPENDWHCKVDDMRAESVFLKHYDLLPCKPCKEFQTTSKDENNLH